jgi:CRP/FNR family transcriptional regulator, cyclic AMP receptor protein
MSTDAELLRDIPLFQTMDDAERSAVAALTDEAHFAAGARLFHEHDMGGVCYVVRSGRVELSVLDETGQKLVVDVVEPGELFGELSLFDGGNRSAGAVALTEVDALVLERDEFLAFLKRNPDAALDVLAALTKRIRRADTLLKHRIQNPNELIEERETVGNRIADGVAAFGGSWRFIIMFLSMMLVWITANLVAHKSWDPYPFILLNLVLSMLAALQAPVIMMSQNRQDAKDRIRSEADFQINVKAEVEIAELHEKLDKLAGEIRLARLKSGGALGAGGTATPAS